MSLPHFGEFGWEPFVLAVAPTHTDVLEPLLEQSIPPSVCVERVEAIPAAISRLVGIGDVALRAWPALQAAGARLIRAHDIDLVYFSTTMFFAMPLGRVWKGRFDVPYVLDFQDPWLSDYYQTHPEAKAPPKYGVARRLHAVLEPWALARTDGIVAVSPDYVETLQREYPSLRSTPACVLPFGAAASDFDVAERHPQKNRHFDVEDGRVNGVYVGRGGDDMSTALEIVFRALQLGLSSAPDAFEPVAMHFVGTSYATDRRAENTVQPVADRVGVGSRVRETPARVPYFEAIQLLKDADFLLVVGSDDPAYTASKIYPYILARKPLVAVVHERSTIVDVLRETGAGEAVTFSSAATAEQKADAACRLCSSLAEMLASLPGAPGTDWRRFERYTAREMTRRQCELFDSGAGPPPGGRGMTARLAIVTSHPIQYQAPWFRALAQATDLEVFFCHRQDAAGQAAAGFGVEFDWDVPLLDGYRHTWLENRARHPGVSSFSGCDTPEISARLRAGRFDACLVCGWYLKSYLQAILAARRSGIPVLCRGDSQLATTRAAAWRAAKYLPYRWLLGGIGAHLYVGKANYEVPQTLRCPGIAAVLRAALRRQRVLRGTGASRARKRARGRRAEGNGHSPRCGGLRVRRQAD